MRQSSVRGERPRRRRSGTQQQPDADQLGWDDSLYKDAGPPPDAPDRIPGAVAVSADGAGDGKSDKTTGRSDGKTARGGKGGRGGGRRKGGDAAAHGGRRRRRKGRVLRWTALGLGFLLVGGAGAGYLYYEHLNSNLRKGKLDLGEGGLRKPEPNAFGQTPLNILLIGSDGRNNEKNIKLGGAGKDRDRKPLGDVQMLLHVSADRSNMSVMSIPRDTRVPIPKCTDPNDGHVYPQITAAINQSLQRGGPGCTVATWKELTGVYIDHFMMVDFGGVVDMADAIGGVPVCVDNNIYSHNKSDGHGSGLKLTKGTHSVKGVQALQWLRTRYGFEDNTDIGRAKAQHMYMNSMVRQLKSGTKLTDPGKLRDLAEAATKALTVDDDLGSPMKLYDLAGELRRVPTKRITMITMPWVYGPGERYVLPKPGDAEQTFALLRNDTGLDGKDTGKKKKKAPDPKPSTPKEQLKVVVQNGTQSTVSGPVPGRAAVVQQHAAQLGYTAAGTDSTLTSQADTTVEYSDGKLRGDALALAKALGLPTSAVRESGSAEGLRLIVGNDWRTGTVYPKPAGGGDDSGKAPENDSTLNGEDNKACMKVNPQYTF
ncbi:LCP family protein [Streptomyces benahoarensis]|uniref:LytR family transcriptional regulator n=1 Tax=Streptomyces benahoarensis TaxID=2595054 RepID=A0A553YZW7_9ACTN|nr:LCP family protein [Streptomyces benahoarensis]TSB18039.1 LytR family transcriptional regulator [Streptomyces benahoarensis]TSB34739.1 LytR family transcriptional regulator [Streptomyces benahoarensis]